MSLKDDIKLEVAKPEWLDEGLKHAEQTFKLARRGKIPEVIKGWMIRTACLRVLRSLYGSDLATAAAIRQHCLDAEDRAMMAQSLAAAGYEICEACGEQVPVLDESHWQRCSG